MATDAADSAKTQSARASTREGDGALSAVGLIAMTIFGLGFLALVSMLGSRVVVVGESETDQARSGLFCPLHGNTLDWSPALATPEAPDQD